MPSQPDTLDPSGPQPEAPAFYVEATLPLDARSYIRRHADQELFETLRDRHYAYVLDASQVGKSSLMLRAMQRLEAETAARTAHIDLQRVGLNVTPEQFYAGIVSQMVARWPDGKDVWDLWRGSRADGVGAAHRWLSLLAAAVARADSPVVVFIDEVQLVRGHAVGDEFFAAIRSAFTERINQPAFNRLTFCLLGTATPTDLTSDARVSLLNIGRQIRLTDFSSDEAAPLAQGLVRQGVDASALLNRVLYWTDGHPYLTQRVCLAIADRPEIRTRAAVDGLCRELFLGRTRYTSAIDAFRKQAHGAGNWLRGSLPAPNLSDPNLIWVKRNLLTDEASSESSADERGATLERLALYRKALRLLSRVLHDERSPALDALRVAGVVKVRDGHFRVRNRIYARVFSQSWVKHEIANRIGDAALREERRRRRLSRTILAAGTVLSTVLVAWGAQGLATARARADDAQKRFAEVQEWAASAQADAVDALSQAKNSEKRAADSEARADRADAAYRQFQDAEGRQRRELAQMASQLEASRHVATLTRLSGEVWPQEGLATTGEMLRRLNPQSPLRPAAEYLFAKGLRRMAGTTQRDEHRGAAVTAMAATADGRWTVTGDNQGAVFLWEAATGRAEELRGHRQGADIKAMAFSRDGRWLLTGGDDAVSLLWNLDVRPPAQARKIESGPISVAAVSEDGRWIATMPDGARGSLVLRQAESPGTTYEASYVGTPKSLAFLAGPEPRLVARVLVPGRETDLRDSRALIWHLDARTRKLGLPNPELPLAVEVAVHPSGQLIALLGAGSEAHDVQWVDTVTMGFTRRGKAPSSVLSGAFSRDGKTLFTGHTDGVLRAWPGAGSGSAPAVASPGGGSHIHHISISADGLRIFGSGDRGPARLWDLTTRRVVNLNLTEGRQTLGVFAAGDRQSVLFTATTDGLHTWNVAETFASSRDSETTLRIDGVKRPTAGQRASTASTTSSTRPAAANENISVRSAKYDQTGSWLGAFPFELDGATTPPRLWNRRDGSTLTVDHLNVRDLVFDAGGQWLVTLASKPYEAKVWDLRSRRPIRFPAGELSGVLDAHFGSTQSSDGPLLLLAGHTPDVKAGRVSIWHPRAVARRASATLEFEEPVSNVQAFNSGPNLVVAVLDLSGRLYVVQPELGTAQGGESSSLAQKVGASQRCGAPGSPILDVDAGLKVSPDGTLAAADEFGAIYLWRTRELRPGPCKPMLLPGATGQARVRAFELGVNGLIAVSYLNGEVRLAQLEGGVVKDFGLSRPSHRIDSWAFSPDGRYLAGAGQATSATLWDVSTTIELDTFTHGAGNEINGVAFHPDGANLVTVADQGEVRIWPLVVDSKEIQRAVAQRATRWPAPAAEGNSGDRQKATGATEVSKGRLQ